MKRQLLLTLFLLGPGIFFAQNTDHETRQFRKTVDSIVMSKMDQYAIPGLAIGVVRDNSVLYTKGYGVREIGTDKLVSEQSIFHTASISKLFTAMAIIHLEDQGKLSIDDKLIDVIPNLQYVEEGIKEITIKQLLNHTSGLPDVKNYHWSKNNQAENSLRNSISRLKLKLLSPPASDFHYSNLAYDILGYVIEVASGVAFEDYVETHILKPSGMAYSDFRYFRTPEALRVAPHSKRWSSQKVYVRKTYPYTREHAPSSTLNASSEDLAKWMVSFLAAVNDGASPSPYADMLVPSSAAYSKMGLGFQLYEFEDYKAVGHFGGDQGFRSFLMMIPEQNIGLVVLGNCDYEEDYRQEIIMPIARLMLKL